jgi:hypothetical protein
MPPVVNDFVYIQNPRANKNEGFWGARDMAELFDTYCPYMPLITGGLYSQAVDEGLTFLKEMKRFAPNEYERTPKGTPFYMLGIAASLSYDFQTGTFLFDAAVAEDLKHQPNRYNAPALLTMQLEDRDPKHAAYPIVMHVVAKIDAALNSYNGRPGCQHLTLDDVRKHFLSRVLAEQPHVRTLTTTFISFFLEWNYRSELIELSEAGSREPFFMHLFRGCLLFESLLKTNPNKSTTNLTLGGVLTELSAGLGIPAQLKISSGSFDEIVQSLMPSQSMDATIQCTGKTRNTLGHNLVWAAASLDAAKYNLLAENIAVSCLHAISCLYR